MDEKEWRKEVFNTSNQDLTFTLEDRKKVFDRIENQQEKRKARKNKHFTFRSKLAPFFAFCVAFIVLIGLTLPSVYDNRIENDNALPASVQDDIVNSFSMLLMVKNSNNRTDTNIVLTYNGYEKSIKFVSLPRDTYVSINTSKESKRMNDKLLHAYTYGGPETAVNSVSKLLDIPIDYYTVVDIESFTKILDSLSLFIKEKGDSSLSKVDLLTNSKKVDNQQLLNELAKILEETKGNIRLSLLQQNISHLETNFPKEQLRLISRDAEISAIKTLDLSEGIIGVEINNIYYEKLDSTLLERVSTELKFHLENK